MKSYRHSRREERPRPRAAYVDDENRPQADLSVREVLRLIPRDKRRGAAGTVALSLMISLLDFAGVAVLVPILLLTLSGESALAEYPILASFAQIVGADTFGGLVAAVCIAVVIIVIFKSLLALAGTDSINRYLLSLFRRYSSQMLDDTLARGLLYVRSHNTARMVNDINGVCLRFTDGVLGQLFSIVSSAGLLLLIVAALSCYDLRLVALAAALFVPVTLLYTLVFRRSMNRNGRLENKLFVAQNKLLLETLRGYADLEVNNAVPYVASRFRCGLATLSLCRRRASIVRSSAGRMTELALIIGIALMIIIGTGAGIPMDELKVSLGLFAVAAYKIVPAVSRIANCWVEYKRNLFAAERINEAAADTDRHGDTRTGRMKFEREIRLHDVSFRYESSGSDIIAGLSLAIRRGEKIGISGPSGRGKSTLLNLLCGLFPPTSGTIEIDDTPLTPANRRLWQNTIAYVSQDTFISDASLAENIAFGIAPEEIDMDRVRRAATDASLAAFIASLPDGLDTVPGESGCRLSGGQRQRIGIARALYKEASVLLLDEATSSLDSDTEREIVAAIDRLASERADLTVIIVSHRESTLAGCDRKITL